MPNRGVSSVIMNTLAYSCINTKNNKKTLVPVCVDTILLQHFALALGCN